MVDVVKQRPIETENELYIASFVGDKMDWGLGSIEAPDYTEAEKKEIAGLAIESMVKVSDSQMELSGCTDGRLRLHLADGSDAPVREKLVGADTVTAFQMAEALGERFYKDPSAPLATRVKEVVDHLVNYGIKPSTHGPSCGAAAGFPAIVDNAIRLSENSRYIARQKALLPQYDEAIHHNVLKGYQQRLEKGLYDGWSEDLIRNAVLESTGEQGVKILLDDHKGVHGHQEIMIARVKPRGVTIKATLFAARANGAQLFTVNDARQEYLASTFARGNQHELDYLIALHASEDLQDAGHATLSKNLATLVIEAK